MGLRSVSVGLGFRVCGSGCKVGSVARDSGLGVEKLRALGSGFHTKSSMQPSSHLRTAPQRLSHTSPSRGELRPYWPPS